MDKKELDPSVIKVIRELNGKMQRDRRAEQTLKWFFSALVCAIIAGVCRYVVGQCETEFYQGVFTWPMWVHAITAAVYSTRLFFRGAFALVN